MRLVIMLFFRKLEGDDSKNLWDAIQHKSHQAHACQIFLKDRIACGDISLKYFPTKEMLVDKFTKPLQEALFIKLRASKINIPISMTDEDMGKTPADFVITKQSVQQYH